MLHNAKVTAFNVSELLRENQQGELTHTHTHARTHARTHAHTQNRVKIAIYIFQQSNYKVSAIQSNIFFILLKSFKTLKRHFPQQPFLRGVLVNGALEIFKKKEIAEIAKIVSSPILLKAAYEFQKPIRSKFLWKAIL